MEDRKEYLSEFKRLCSLNNYSDSEILSDSKMKSYFLHYIDIQIIIEKHNAEYQQKLLEAKESLL